MDNGRDVRKRTRRDQESNTTVPTGRKKRNKRPFAAAEDDAHEDQEDEAKTLRVVARSERFFWRPTIQDQLSHVVIDRAERCVKRAVPENEVLACALNEVAVAAGRGFFLYLPSRNVWKIAANETLLPAGRVPPQPGSAYPSMLFMDFIHDDVSKQRFYGASHRARYLLSNAIFNLPPEHTPLYSIQYATSTRSMIYSTAHPSLVLHSSSNSFFLGSTEDHSRIKRKPRGGSNPELRLEPFDVWKDASAYRGRKLDSLEMLYDAIRDSCRAMDPTLSARELEEAVIPRPLASDLAAVASTGLGTRNDGMAEAAKSGPSSRVGERRRPRTKDKDPVTEDPSDRDQQHEPVDFMDVNGDPDDLDQ